MAAIRRKRTAVESAADDDVNNDITAIQRKPPCLKSRGKGTLVRIGL
jgi:hypothetical protein